MPIQSNRAAFVLLSLVCLIWGVGFVVVDHALNNLTTQSLNALRFSLAALCLLPLWLWSRRRETKVATRALLQGGVSLGFILFLAFYTQTEGLRFTSVSNTGFITGMAVPLVPVLGYVLFRHKPVWSAWLAAAVATLGLYWLTGGASSLNKGDLLVLASAFCYASHMVLTGHFAAKLPVLALSMVQLTAVAVYSLVASLLFDNEPQKMLFSLDPAHWARVLSADIWFALFWMSALATAFAFWVQTSCQVRLPAHKVALIFALEPIFGHLAAAIWLDERLHLMGWLGAAMIVVSMLIAELGDKAHKPKIHAVDQTAAPT